MFLLCSDPCASTPYTYCNRRIEVTKSSSIAIAEAYVTDLPNCFRRSTY
jgi:hypothetical protein